MCCSCCVIGSEKWGRTMAQKAGLFNEGIFWNLQGPACVASFMTDSFMKGGGISAKKTMIVRFV